MSNTTPIPTGGPAWLLFSFSFPAKGQAARVKTLRRLHGLGAIPIKNTLYLLPAGPHHQEQLTWLGREVEERGGEVVMAVSSQVLTLTPEQIRAAFSRARDTDYAALEEDIRLFMDRPADQEPGGPAVLRRLSRRLDALRGIDFFPTGLGQALERLLAQAGRSREEEPPVIPGHRTEDYQGRVWITRADPHVDRLASFWLVRRFIDPEAEVVFESPDAVLAPQPGEVRFDMAQGEFTHQGGLITFEVMVAAFRLEERIPARLRRVLRAVDLLEFEAAPPETLGVRRMLDGLAVAFVDGQVRMAVARTFFDALLASYANQQQ